MVISYSAGSRAKSECIRLTAWRKRRSWGVAACGRFAFRRGHRGGEQQTPPPIALSPALDLGWCGAQAVMWARARRRGPGLLLPHE